MSVPRPELDIASEPVDSTFKSCAGAGLTCPKDTSNRVPVVGTPVIALPLVGRWGSERNAVRSEELVLATGHRLSAAERHRRIGKGP
ncbi:unannotated protein [freshwater metagenome]|uniref:Unannotated protein n=1 Tax=freshwater metagenome TaxID=449393 RepID=A0A6J7R8E1_9ZZZZ